MVSHEVEQLSVESEDASDLRIAEARRAVRDGVKDRLDIRQRAGDHAQNLARRRLLFQRVGQSLLQSLALASLELAGFRLPLDRLLQSLNPTQQCVIRE